MSFKNFFALTKTSSPANACCHHFLAIPRRGGDILSVCSSAYVNFQSFFRAQVSLSPRLCLLTFIPSDHLQHFNHLFTNEWCTASLIFLWLHTSPCLSEDTHILHPNHPFLYCKFPAPALDLSLILTSSRFPKPISFPLVFIYLAFLTPYSSSWLGSLSQIFTPQTLPTSHIYLAASPEKSPD